MGAPWAQGPSPDYEAETQMSGRHPNVRQTTKWQADTQMIGRHPNVRQALGGEGMGLLARGTGSLWFTAG